MMTLYSGKLYGKDKWEPKRIIIQILTMQLLYYVSLAIVLALLSLAHFGLINHSMSALLSPHNIHFSDASGWIMTAAQLCTAIAGAWYLRLVVERSKKCLDFAFTQYFCHFVIVCVYRGFPTHWQWWVVQVVCIAVMAQLGEFLCMRAELAEIGVEDLMRKRAPSDSTRRRSAGGAARVKRRGGDAGGGREAAGAPAGAGDGARLSAATSKYYDVVDDEYKVLARAGADVAGAGGGGAAIAAAGLGVAGKDWRKDGAVMV